ncbi:hypothetical protein C9J12_22750 [Photobacterium frigidiphilum]|uniref:Uncharacterized protein n=1 Tax=Photobacterium frigidiphilum TaxID=264736 RepID=A0A2T3J978_9GAMM|nr:hypothetical protein C9J12_22750 [Photobacterium frigidiphilum]
MHSCAFIRNGNIHRNPAVLLLRLSNKEALTIRNESMLNQLMVEQTTRGRFSLQSLEQEVGSLQTSFKKQFPSICNV